MGIPHVLDNLDDDFPSCRADEQMLLQTLLFPTAEDSRSRRGKDHVATRSRATPSQPCTHPTLHVYSSPRVPRSACQIAHVQS